jgi:tetratricopeptide (TPR) repeat protein
MKHFRLRTPAGLIILWAALMGSPAHAQDALQQIKSLYASAAYEDALTLVTRIDAGARRPELEKYRVFCLIALGKTAEAEKAIATVVTENPSFQPDAGEASPRVREMFARVRRALVPDIAQRMYLEGRAALDRKDVAASSARFEALVALIEEATKDSPELETDEPMLPELKLLASGFLDLNRAAARKAEAAAPQLEPPNAAARTPLEISSPVPVKQDLPVWLPPDPLSRREFRGALRVFISASGQVTGAELSPAIHPVYDRQLLTAARMWEYQPALRNGVPIASEKVIEVVLRPR